MIAHFPARRSLRQFARSLIALLPLLLAVCCLPVRAAERLAATSGASSKSHAQHAPAPQHKARKSSRSRRAPRRSAAVILSTGMRLGLRDTADELAMKSSAVLVVDRDSGETLALKNPDVVLPIASLTKLMTALVVIDSGLPMNEILQIASDDVDTERKSHSRLAVGTVLSRDNMLLLALMSSENRAAMALSRNYPGGREAFVAQMNVKAQALGMSSTHFADPAGLLNGSVSTARDLQRLLNAAYAQPLIRADTTQPESSVKANNGRLLTFVNSNRMVRAAGDWNIELQKTGFTNEAGRCLIMQATVLSRRLAMIFLDSTGTLTRYADAARVRRRLELDAKAAPPHLAGGAATAAAAVSASYH